MRRDCKKDLRDNGYGGLGSTTTKKLNKYKDH